MTEACIGLDQRASWEAALDGIPHGFAHTWASNHAMHLTTGWQTYLYCVEDGGARIVCPLAERRHGGYVDVVTPYGMGGFTGRGVSRDFPERWRRFLAGRGYVCAYVGLNPLFERASDVSAEHVFRANAVYVLDLRRSLDELFAALDQSRRRELRGSRRTAPEVILDRPRLEHFFLANYHRFMRDTGAAPVYDFSSATLDALLAADRVLLVGAGSEAEVEAVLLLAHTPYAGDCMFSVATGEGRRHAATLIWYAVHHLKSLGVPFLNLGGGVRDEDGVGKFKRRFGGRRLPLGALKQVVRADVYEALCGAAGADPGDRSGYFPAYRSPAPPRALAAATRGEES